MPELTDTTQSSRMKDAFDKARRAAEAKDLRTAEQWKQVREIERRADKLRDEAERRFNATRKKQQQTEVERLLRYRYSPKRTLKPKGVSDRSDVLRQADKNIRQRHEQRLARIDRAKERMIDEVRKQARETRSFEVRFERSAQTRQRVEMKNDFGRSR